MADLITHGCVALLWKATSRGPRVGVFLAGTALPDLVGRVPPMALTELRWTWPWIPEWLVYLWVPVHMPVGMVVGAYFASMFLPAAGRADGFRNLLGGALLHLALDVLQRHFGIGYLLLFPFSLWDWEAGLLGSEDTVRVVPFLVPVTALIWWWRRGRGGGERMSGGPPPPSHAGD